MKGDATKTATPYPGKSPPILDRLNTRILLRKGAFTTINVPGASGSLPAMIAAGRIIGGYFLNNHTHGFQL